jgi:cytochrome c
MAVCGLVASLLLTHSAFGQTSPQQRGEAITRKKCSACHSVGMSGDSPMGLAPPFRDLSKRYPIEQLAEALAEGIVTGHSAMPQFTFEPREIEALLTYLQSLSQASSDRR